MAHAEAPSVNLSNSNAARVLRLLGLWAGEGDSLCGRADATDVADRATGYLLLSECPAVAWDEYAVTRITTIREVAEYAERHGLGVTWA